MSILICAEAIMARGICVALESTLPDLKCLACRGAIEANIEEFAHLASTLRPQMTILDADSVAVRSVLETLGKDVLPSFGAPGSLGMLGKIVVLTTKPDEEVLFTLAKYGARACVSGCLPGGDLAQVVRDLLDDDQLYLLDSRTFADPDLALIARQRLQAERVMQAVLRGGHEEDEKPRLTDLDLRLLRGLSCGMSTHVAARHAGVSYWQAKTIIPVLAHKLQVGNRTGAVIRAWELGLIDLPETDMILRYTGAAFREAGTPDERISGLDRCQAVATS